MGCSLPGSSVHGIIPARIPEQLPFPAPGNLPDPGIQSAPPASPVLSGGFFTTEQSGKPSSRQQKHLISSLPWTNRCPWSFSFLQPLSWQVCILECEEKVFTSPLWTPCTKVMARGSWQLSPADPDHVAAAPDQARASEMQHLKRMPRVRSLFQRQKRTEPGLEEVGDMEQKQLQKRFGGFTGARKSARKLANQKRFSEFMRQYLVLSMQSSQRRRTLHQNGNA